MNNFDKNFIWSRFWNFLSVGALWRALDHGHVATWNREEWGDNHWLATYVKNPVWWLWHTLRCLSGSPVTAMWCPSTSLRTTPCIRSSPQRLDGESEIFYHNSKYWEENDADQKYLQALQRMFSASHCPFHICIFYLQALQGRFWASHRTTLWTPHWRLTWPL